MFSQKDRRANSPGTEAGISIIGPDMLITGEVVSRGTVRVQGELRGTVRAHKSVFVAKGGLVDGEILTEDAVISGSVRGRLTVRSLLEVQTSADVDGEVQARRLQVHEGARLNGEVRVGELEGEEEMELSVAAEEADTRPVSAAVRTG